MKAMNSNGLAVAGFLCLAAVGSARSLEPADVLREAAEKAAGQAGHVGAAVKPQVPVKWVEVAKAGAGFAMGSPDVDRWFDNAKPVHWVTFKQGFELSKTLVTVEQYAVCVDKGKCWKPGTQKGCSWGLAGRELHPVDCVSWQHAQQYAKFMGARLPSEAEWEYAARSGGKLRKYPWGDDAPLCSKVVMGGCDPEGTRQVCSKPEGNARLGEGRELCDMAGNLWQWTQDSYHGIPNFDDPAASVEGKGYFGAPSDGGAWEKDGYKRVLRGGSHETKEAELLRAAYRVADPPGLLAPHVGFRLARSLP